MVEVRCDSVTKIFRSAEGETTAVDDVDLTIEDGTFATLLGPSGCGKTTLLRMLAGLEMPSDGAIYFDDDEMTNVEVQDRNVSMVFQSIALFPFMTVRENIEYGLKYRDVDKGIVREKVKEMAEKLEIDDLLDKKPSKIFGGQRQRVSLARSLVRRTDGGTGRAIERGIAFRTQRTPQRVPNDYPLCHSRPGRSNESL